MPGIDDDGIVDQVLSLCDTNFDAMLSLDEAKDCEVCNISSRGPRLVRFQFVRSPVYCESQIARNTANLLV